LFSWFDISVNCYPKLKTALTALSSTFTCFRLLYFSGLPECESLLDGQNFQNRARKFERAFFYPERVG